MKLTRFSGAGALLAATALLLAACGGGTTADTGSGSSSSSSSSTGAGSLSGDLSGAGSTAQQAAMQAWQAGFQEANPQVTVNYDPVGSGGGRDQFLSGGTLFAGSDAALTTDELTKSQSRCAGSGGAIDLPVYISPIAIAYNLSGVDSLQLSPDTAAKIFAGKITKWNDPAIKADNPGATLPGDAITPVHRSDPSGTTENFTDYLSKAAPGSWTYPASEEWPVKGGEAANGTSGVIQAVQSGSGTIGYADASQLGNLKAAKVKVGSSFVEVSAESAAKVAEVSQPMAGRPAGDLAIDVARDTTASGAYPIVLISYHVVCRQYQTQSEADLVKAFETYVVSAAGQQAAASAAGSAPLSDALRQKVQASIDSISAAS